MAALPTASPRGIVALLVLAAMVLAPALWIGWSLSVASTVAESNRSQGEILASLQGRLAALKAGAGTATAATESVFLPGETPAIAGAALQRLVADTVEGAGGTLEESEISRPEGEEPDQAEPGAVNLRVSFSADIVGLQRIVFELETRAPILMLQGLTIEAREAAAAEEGGGSPVLNVVLMVRGYREA